MTSSSPSPLVLPATQASSAPSPTDPGGDANPETWAEKLYAALPLFIVGGACLVVAIELYFAGIVTGLAGNGSVHLEPWTLFLALAVTGLSAGTFALLVEEVPPGPSEVPAAPVVEVVEPSPIPPEWDESTIAPETTTSQPLSSRSWERYSESPGSPESPESQPISSEAFLSQLDEIAVSLQKRVRAPPPE